MDYSKYVNKLDYKADKKAYNLEDARLLALFWSDLFDSYTISLSHPKADKLKELSWSFGHAYGLQGVENYFSQFVELVV